MKKVVQKVVLARTKKVIQRITIGKGVSLFLGDKKFTPRQPVRLAVEVARAVESNGHAGPVGYVRLPNPIFRVIVGRKLFARVVASKEAPVHVKLDATPGPVTTAIQLPAGHTHFFRPASEGLFMSATST